MQVLSNDKTLLEITAKREIGYITFLIPEPPVKTGIMRFVFALPVICCLDKSMILRLALTMSHILCICLARSCSGMLLASVEVKTFFGCVWRILDSTGLSIAII